MVLYADEVSFTLMTPEGHMFAGWITFSAFEEAARRVAQTQVLMRAQDPIGELGLDVRRARQGEHVLGADARGARRVARRRGRGRHDAGRLRRPQAPVVAGEERAPLGRDPLDAAHDEARQVGARAPSRTVARSADQPGREGQRRSSPLVVHDAADAVSTQRRVARAGGRGRACGSSKGPVRLPLVRPARHPGRSRQIASPVSSEKKWSRRVFRVSTACSPSRARRRRGRPWR